MTLEPMHERLDRRIEEVKAERQALQSDIPDDLKADAELPLDIRGALTSLYHQAMIAADQSSIVADAASRLLAALDRAIE